MPTLDQRKNFAKGIVSTGYNASATTIVLATNEGNKFPSFAGNPFNVVWWNSTDFADPADDPTAEIVRVTGRTGDSLTVTRGQEGTSAVTHNSGSKVYKMALCLTKKMIDDIEAVTTSLTKSAFLAKADATSGVITPSWIKIEYHEVYDPGSCYDNSQHAFVAPKTGYYFISACFEAVNAASKTMTGLIVINSDSPIAAMTTPACSASALHHVELSCVLSLNLNDVVTIWGGHSDTGNLTMNMSDGRNRFQGFCVYNGS